MGNPIPRNSSQLTTLAGNNIAGLAALGSELGITQITAAGLQGLLDGFVAADATFNEARSALGMAYDEFHTAEDALSAWLAKARALFTIVFGARWNPQWVQAGYGTPTTALPTTIDGRMGLALRVIGFLTAQPAYENAPAGVTAAIGRTLQTATAMKQQVVAVATTTSKQALADRAAAAAPLGRTMRSLVQMLAALLAPDDARWRIFGLNAPGAEVTPGQPQNLSAIASGSGAILVRCGAVPLAKRYRWRTRVVGAEVSYTLARSSADPTTLLPATPPGATLEIIAQAVNGSLQGIESEPVLFTVPAAAAAAVAKVATPELAPHSNGNGHALARV